MKILVFSDTHGFANDCDIIINRYEKIDGIIHAGDIAHDEDYLKQTYPNIPLYAVCGNNDFCCEYPYDLTVTLGGKKIFITHGHRHSVRLGNFALKDMINKDGYDLVVYGHTHIPEHDYCGSGQILNPGSLFYGNTYGVIDIEPDSLMVSIIDFKK